MSSCRQCGWPWVEKDGLCKSCLAFRENPDGLSKRKTLGGVPFEDMKHLDEVDRIDQIVEHLTKNPGRRILVMVDIGDGFADKGDRYIKSIREKLPQVKVVNRQPGPVSGAESIVLIL